MRVAYRIASPRASTSFPRAVRRAMLGAMARRAVKTKPSAKKTAPKKTAPKKTAPKKTAPKKTAPEASRAAALHQKAAYHNWDDGVRGLSQILRDPACDLGTALMIYWMGVPGFDRAFVTADEAPDWRRPVTKFLRELEERILARDFATANILFDPRFDRTTVNHLGHDWTAAQGTPEVRRPIPAALLEPSAPDPEREAQR
jgi:hypothetical protein